jgi:predicted Zn-dependent protease
MRVTCCAYGGKITVHTGFLDHFNTEDEIAAALAHEILYVLILYWSIIQ